MVSRLFNFTTMKTFRLIGTTLLVIILVFTFTSCDKDDDENNNIDNVTIVGEWQDGTTTLKFGSDGSYLLTDRSIPTHIQYRRGTYSYNSKQGLLSINVKAVPNENGAYQQTLIVQTLTKSTLVLLYTDGDVEGYYERIK